MSFACKRRVGIDSKLQRVHQEDDVGKGQEADAGHERGDGHGLTPNDGRKQFAGVEEDDAERRGDSELAHHRQRHGDPQRI